MSNSRLDINDCLLRINESVNQDLNSLEEEFRNQALKELRSVIKLAQKKNTGQNSALIVHVSARRLHFYGKIGVMHPGEYQGRYRIRIETDCWIVSDNSVPQNKIFVTIV